MAVIKTAAEVEEFIGTVWQAYSIMRKFFPLHAVFFPASKGEVKNAPQTEPRDAVNKADGTDHADETDTLTAIEVPLELPLKRWTHINKDDYDVRPDLSLFSNYSNQMGLDLGVGENRRVSLTLIGAADTAGREAAFDATADGFATRFAKEIRDTSAQFDEDGVPDDGGRFMWCTPSLFYELRTVEGVIRLDFGGQADVMVPREVLAYNSFKIMSLPGVFGNDFTASGFANLNLPAHQSVDASTTVAIAAHRTAWIWRQVKGIERIGPDWIPERDQWKIETRLHQGIRSRNTDGLWILTNSAT